MSPRLLSFIYCKYFFSIFVLLVFLFSDVNGAWKTKLTITGDRFYINGKETKLWGVRLASASINAENTDDFLKYLDDYKAHGINCISVFLMGSSGGAADPFSPDGRSIDLLHRTRAEKIIEELDKRNMVCVLGIFYQNVGVYGGFKKLTDWDASLEAVKTTATWLKKKKYTNIILNIANEQNSRGYDDDPWGKVRVVGELCRMCSIANKIYQGMVVGAGGYHEVSNKELSVCPDVEVLLYDTADPVEGDYYTDKTLYDAYRSYLSENNIAPKPLFNVEQFGAYSKKFEPPQGNYEKFPNGKTYYFKCIDIALENPGLNTTFHSNVWYQGDKQLYKNRFDMGGQGLETDPGVHWYFDYLQERLGIKSK